MKKKMRRLPALILAIALIFAALPIVSAVENNEPYLTVSQSTGKPGETVDITISIENNPGIVSMSVRAVFDSSVMTLTAVNDAGNLGAISHSNKYESPYYLAWVNDTVRENFTFNGPLVTLSFTIAENAPAGEYPVTLEYDCDNYDIYDVEVEPIYFSNIPGSVTVQSSESVPDTTPPTIDLSDDVYRVNDDTAIGSIKLIDAAGNECGFVGTDYTSGTALAQFNAAGSDFVINRLTPGAEYTLVAADAAGNESSRKVAATGAGNIAVSLSVGGDSSQQVTAKLNSVTDIATNSAEPTAMTAPVVSAETEPQGYVGEEQIITVVTSANAYKIQLTADSGSTRTYKYDHSAVKSIADNGDGTLTWTLAVEFPAGDKSFTVSAREGLRWTKSSQTVSFTIGEKRAVILSAAAENAEVKIGDKANIVIKTSTNAKKVRLINAKTGGTTTVSYGYTDEDGVRTWTVSPRIASENPVTYHVEVKDSYGWKDYDESFDVTVTGAAEAKDTAVYSIDAPESAKAGERIHMTVVTGKDVSKIRILAGLGTSTFSTYTQTEDGKRVWSVYCPAGSIAGTRTVSIQTKSGLLWTTAEKTEVEIVK